MVVEVIGIQFMVYGFLILEVIEDSTSLLLKSRRSF